MTSTNKPVRFSPFMLIGIIFAVTGLSFFAMGVGFLIGSGELLPLLADSALPMEELPDEAALPILGIVFSVLGGLFAVLGGVFLMQNRRQGRLREELLRYGTRVQGTVSDLQIDRTYTVNGRHPLRILVRATHPYTGEEMTLRAPLVWETTLATGDAVPVLFDPQDEKKHLVLLTEESAS